MMVHGTKANVSGRTVNRIRERTPHKTELALRDWNQSHEAAQALARLFAWH